MRSPLRIMAATTLTMQALVVLLASLVAKDMTSLSNGAAFGISGGLALLCLLAAGLLRSPAGYGLGSVVQVLTICYGVWVHTMYFVGALFALLWIASLYYGVRIDRELRARAAAQEAAGAGRESGITPADGPGQV